MNWVLIQREEIDGGRVVLDDRRAGHLLGVLGVTVGQAVRVAVENVSTGTGLVVETAPQRVVLEFTSEHVPAKPRTTLLLAMPRPKVMRRLWLHLPALDVCRVAVVKPYRTPKDYFGTHWLAEDSYVPLLREGSEQAGSPWCPAVSVHRGFGRIIKQLPAPGEGDLRVVAHPGRGEDMLSLAWRGASGDRVLAIGPEGGWTDVELGLLENTGFQLASLGRRPMRTDAACIAALSLLSMAGDTVRHALP